MHKMLSTICAKQICPLETTSLPAPAPRAFYKAQHPTQIYQDRTNRHLNSLWHYACCCHPQIKIRLGTLSDKGKPAARLGRNATDQNKLMAGLPKRGTDATPGGVPISRSVLHAQAVVSALLVRTEKFPIPLFSQRLSMPVFNRVIRHHDAAGFRSRARRLLELRGRHWLNGHRFIGQQQHRCAYQWTPMDSRKIRWGTFL